MSRQEEGKLRSKIREYLLSNGAWVHVPSGYGGIPDLITCILGKFICFEVKIDTSVSEQQKWQREAIYKAGGQSYVVYSFKEAKDIIDKEFENEII